MHLARIGRVRSRRDHWLVASLRLDPLRRGQGSARLSQRLFLFQANSCVRRLALILLSYVHLVESSLASVTALVGPP